MKLNFASFTAAVRAHLSPSAAANLPGAAIEMMGAVPDYVEDSASGELILRAMIGVCPIAELSSVTVPMAIPLSLPAADALTHPLFAPWIAETLTSAVAAPIVAGARGFDLDPLAPELGAIQVVNVEGQWCGLAALHFRHDVPFVAMAHYGAMHQGVPLMSITSISGVALRLVGIAARAVAEVAEAPVEPVGGGGGGIGLAQLEAASGAIN